MAVVTGGADILVVVDSLVVAVSITLIVLMAEYALERCEIGGDNMAVGALIPPSLVSTGIDWEVLTVMVPISRLPGTGGVTRFAGCGEQRCRMARISGSLVIALVTGVALRRSPGITAGVTIETLESQVRAGQGKSCLAMIESRRIPGIGIVTFGAVE
jgi:hypothetical protein